MAEVRRVLRPDGVYVLTAIDYRPLDVLRPEAARLLGEFADVALIARSAADGSPSEAI